MGEQLRRVGTGDGQVVGVADLSLNFLQVVSFEFFELIALVQEDQAGSNVLPEALLYFFVSSDRLLENIDIEFDNLSVMLILTC